MISCAAEFPPLIMFGVRFKATFVDGRTGARVARCIGTDAPDAVLSLLAHLEVSAAVLAIEDVWPWPVDDHTNPNAQGVRHATVQDAARSR